MEVFWAWEVVRADMVWERRDIAASRVGIGVGGGTGSTCQSDTDVDGELDVLGAGLYTAFAGAARSSSAAVKPPRCRCFNSHSCVSSSSSLAKCQLYVASQRIG